MPEKPPKYATVRSVSTAVSKDGSGAVLSWEAGDEFKDYPAHVDIKELLKIGAIEEVKEA